jgi:hypothetical protein
LSQRSSNAEAAIRDGGRPAWLCTIQMPDGRYLRVASRPIEVATAWESDGPYQYLPLLTGLSDFEESLDIFALDGTGALTQARIEFVYPGTAPGSLQADWQHVTAAMVELATLWPGDVWEDRSVALLGQVQSVDFGADGEVTTLSVEAAPPATSATVGDDTRDLGTDFPGTLVDTVAAEMTDLAGCKGVYVYGVVNSIPGYKIGDVGGTNRLVLCNHKLVRTGASYQVTVYVDGVSVGLFTPANGTTAAGDDYAYVTSAGEFQAADGAYTWKSTYGGLPAANGAERPLVTAEGIVRRLLVDSVLAVDWRRTEPTLARLRDWNLGIYLDQEVSAIDALRDLIFPYLPIVEVPGAAGLWLAWCDPHTAQIEAALTFGQELLGRVDRMTTSDLDAIRNQFTMNFDKEVFSGEFTGSVTLDADNSTLCYLSQQLFGVRADDPIDCLAVQDEGAALRILGTRASRLAMPRRIITYELAPDAYWLSAGSVVTITDPGYALTKVRAVLTSINRSMLPFQATFNLVDRTWFTREPTT